MRDMKAPILMLSLFFIGLAFGGPIGATIGVGIAAVVIILVVLVKGVDAL